MKVCIYEAGCDDMAVRIDGLVTSNCLGCDYRNSIAVYANVCNFIEIGGWIHYPAAKNGDVVIVRSENRRQQEA